MRKELMVSGLVGAVCVFAVDGMSSEQGGKRGRGSMAGVSTAVHFEQIQVPEVRQGRRNRVDASTVQHQDQLMQTQTPQVRIGRRNRSVRQEPLAQTGNDLHLNPNSVPDVEETSGADNHQIDGNTALNSNRPNAKNQTRSESRDPCGNLVSPALSEVKGEVDVDINDRTRTNILDAMASGGLESVNNQNENDSRSGVVTPQQVAVELGVKGDELLRFEAARAYVAFKGMKANPWQNTNRSEVAATASELGKYIVYTCDGAGYAALLIRFDSPTKLDSLEFGYGGWISGRVAGFRVYGSNNMIPSDEKEGCLIGENNRAVSTNDGVVSINSPEACKYYEVELWDGKGVNEANRQISFSSLKINTSPAAAE